MTMQFLNILKTHYENKRMYFQERVRKNQQRWSCFGQKIKKDKKLWFPKKEG